MDDTGYWLISYSYEPESGGELLSRIYGMDTHRGSVGSFALDRAHLNGFVIIGAWPVTKEEYDGLRSKIGD